MNSDFKMMFFLQFIIESNLKIVLKNCVGTGTKSCTVDKNTIGAPKIRNIILVHYQNSNFSNIAI